VRLGDAAATLNPLPGLGLSQALAHAGALRSACVETSVGSRHPGEAIASYVRAAKAITDQAWEVSLLEDRPLTRAVAASTGVDLGMARAAASRLIELDREAHALDSMFWHLLIPTDRAAPDHLVRRASAFLIPVAGTS
jgi:2-polyprenyl-6-methoxyphenol hydroxylase-like FAD-dependent oxidoreductase